MNLFHQKEYANQLWKIVGNFGELKEKINIYEDTFSAENGKISVISQFENTGKGVFVRYGKVKNISDDTVILNVLSSKFSLDGGEYEVYSQYNGWQNESIGQWQPLVTTVSAHSSSVRNAHGAAPFMVLWSNQSNRGTAFHLNAYGAWEMRISRIHMGGEAAFVEVEFGIMRDGLGIKLAPGEEFELPEIIYYTVFNKVDMDCWKLHGYLNEKYPRKNMPVIYNSWLYKFDRFSFEDISRQIPKARELGVEYFVIDAGWFGKDSGWWASRGDWEENKNFGFRGRMSEIAQSVRDAGMKFGLWFEPECASKDAEVVKKHPNYFIEGTSSSRSFFVDFANHEAVEYIFHKICQLIEKYGVEFVKFDFNADLDFDSLNSGFTEYFKGHIVFIKKLREKYPELYIENCASGGMRMSIRDGKLYDSFWSTDNQSPYQGLRIFKDTLLRMPPQWIECWATVCSVEKMVPIFGSNEYSDKIIATNDATWDSVVSVHQSFLNGFLTGSPIGLSFDLTSLSETAFSELKCFIAKFKENRDFWKNAVCHILTDTETMLVLEFRNAYFSKVELVVFAKKAMQSNIRVYPVINENLKYKIADGDLRTGEEIVNSGIDFPVNQCYTAQFLTLYSLE